MNAADSFAADLRRRPFPATLRGGFDELLWVRDTECSSDRSRLVQGSGLGRETGDSIEEIARNLELEISELRTSGALDHEDLSEMGQLSGA